MARITSLSLRSVVDLLNEHFVIPSYQRGYRWTQSEVLALLDDIWEFKLASDKVSNTRNFYCLQPLVVSRREDNSLEVLDGQQRLTTIYLILRYLDDLVKAYGYEPFTITYDTRENSASYLKNIDPALSRSNIDFYHMSKAFMAIEEWFKERGRRGQFLLTLLNTDEVGKNVKFIIYDVTNENRSPHFAIDVFSRINIGKIPLTSGELIKALLIQKADLNNVDVRLPSSKIAYEWDEMEKRLRDDAFWYFLFPSDSDVHYDNRIEYLFDLVSGRYQKDEPYYTFHYFLGKLNEAQVSGNAPAVECQWMDIRRRFQTLEEWYRHREIYHLVGFLVERGVRLTDLLTDANGTTKTAFLDKLKQRIADKLPFDISSLEYTSSETKNVLLLFNILTILEAQDSDSRFSFSRYKKEDYDIEHVRSQKDILLDAKGRREWVRMVLNYLEGESSEGPPEQQSRIDALIASLKPDEDIDQAAFSETERRVLDEFKELEPLEGSDCISNLALLDAKTNRSYKNAPFPIKRKIILERDQAGIFVPLATRNLFLKVYSRNKLQVSLKQWDKQDAEDYLQEIRRILQPYIELKAVPK